MIRKIHRLWGGPFPMPADYKAFAERWQTLNPGWEVKDWHPSEVDSRNGRIIDDLHARDAGRNGVELWVQVADVLGYEIVAEHGGVYVNVDVEPVRSLSYLHERWGVPEHSAYAGWCDDEQLVNSVLGAGTAHAQVWEACVDNLAEHYFDARMRYNEMNHSTGPLYMSSVVRGLYGTLWGDGEAFCGLPKEVFNDVHFHEIPLGGDAAGRWQLKDGMVAVHHWGHRRVQRTNYVESATGGR